MVAAPADRSGVIRQPFTDWVIDAALVGGLVGLAVPVGFVATVALLYPMPPPRPSQCLGMLFLHAWFVVASVVLALAVVAPVVGPTRVSWRGSRLASPSGAGSGLF